MSVLVWLGAGVIAWAWLIRQIVRPHGFLDRCDDKPPLACTGCQRHFVRADCPVHRGNT